MYQRTKQMPIEKISFYFLTGCQICLLNGLEDIVSQQREQKSLTLTQHSSACPEKQTEVTPVSFYKIP